MGVVTLFFALKETLVEVNIVSVLESFEFHFFVAWTHSAGMESQVSISVVIFKFCSHKDAVSFIADFIVEVIKFTLASFLLELNELFCAHSEQTFCLRSCEIDVNFVGRVLHGNRHHESWFHSWTCNLASFASPSVIVLEDLLHASIL